MSCFGLLRSARHAAAIHRAGRGSASIFEPDRGPRLTLRIEDREIFKPV